MNKCNIVFCMIVLPLLQSCAKPEWSLARPADCSFSIQMPGIPKEKTTHATSLVYGKMQLGILSLKKENWMFAVSWTDYPAEVFLDPTNSPSLDTARDGAVNGVQGKLLGEEHISMNGFPGRIIRIEPAGGRTTYIAKMVQVNSRFYQVAVVCPKEESFSPDIQRFMDSFVLPSR